MPRKTGSLRGPTPDRDSFRKLSEDLTRFAKSNLRDPDKALAALRASSPSPDRPTVTPDDLIRKSGRDPVRTSNVVRAGSPVAQESHGALLRPQVRRRYGPVGLGQPRAACKHLGTRGVQVHGGRYG